VVRKINKQKENKNNNINGKIKKEFFILKKMQNTNNNLKRQQIEMRNYMVTKTKMNNSQLNLVKIVKSKQTANDKNKNKAINHLKNQLEIQKVQKQAISTE
jgi:hypothetical protein